MAWVANHPCTNTSGYFLINDELKPIITFIPGKTYIFDQSHASNISTLRIYKNSDSNVYDQLYTAGVHLSRTIRSTFQINENSELLITGGGAYNKFWIQKINELNIKTVVPEKKMVEFKEALIFSLLGVLKIRNENNILSSVTGASKDLSAGVLFIPWKFVWKELLLNTTIHTFFLHLQLYI